MAKMVECPDCHETVPAVFVTGSASAFAFVEHTVTVTNDARFTAPGITRTVSWKCPQSGKET